MFLFQRGGARSLARSSRCSHLAALLPSTRTQPYSIATRRSSKPIVYDELKSKLPIQFHRVPQESSPASSTDLTPSEEDLNQLLPIERIEGLHLTEDETIKLASDRSERRASVCPSFFPSPSSRHCPLAPLSLIYSHIISLSHDIGLCCSIYCCSFHSSARHRQGSRRSLLRIEEGSRGET